MLAATRAFTGVRPQARPFARPLVVPSVRPLEQSSFMGVVQPVTGLVAAPARGSLVVMAGSMARTIDGKGSNKKRRGTSGFMARVATPGGKKVLKARRKKGRHVLVPASMKKSAGKK